MSRLTFDGRGSARTAIAHTRAFSTINEFSDLVFKDLALGTELAKSVESRAEWVANREAQKSVKRADLVAEIKAMTQAFDRRDEERKK